MNRADVLVIAPEALVESVRDMDGYFPEEQSVFDPNKTTDLLLLSMADINKPKSEITLVQNPLSENYYHTYQLNRYDGKYYPLDYPNLENILIEQKSHLYREVLRMLGAKRCTLGRKVNEQTTNTTAVNTSIDAGSAVASAKLKVGYNNSNDCKLAYTSELEFEDQENKPQDATSIRLYMQERGLVNETYLNLLLERLEREGVMRGKEKIKVSFCSELDQTKSITSSLEGKLKLYKASLEGIWKSDSKRTYKIEEELVVEF